MQSSWSTSAVIPTINYLYTTALQDFCKIGFLLVLGMVLLDTKPEFHTKNVFLWSVRT